MKRTERFRNDWWNRRIENIYASESGKNGLNVLFEFSEGALLFDADHFRMLDDKKKLENRRKKWTRVYYANLKRQIRPEGRQISVVRIRKGKEHTFFVEFSNGDIFYIYPFRMGRSAEVVRYFELLEKNNTDYPEVFNSMHNEEVMDVILYPEAG